jgi:protein TonB
MSNVFAQHRAREREEGRRRSAARITVPVGDDARAWDLPEEERRGRLVGSMALYVLSAVALHGAVVIALLLAGGARDGERGTPVIERVIVRTIDLPEWPEKRPEEAREQDVPEQEPEAAPEPERPATKRSPARREPERAADPVDVRPEAIDEPAEPRRRVVGISLESTVSAGAGPSFAVGNTRMGRTDDRAADPASVKKLAPSRGAAASGAPAGPNAAATSLPADGVAFEKPRRIGAASLQYPSVLKSQGIDGDVVVLIRITTEGSVSTVKIIRSSGYPEFDEAARKAAVSERYLPATRGGEPVEYSLKYTYRFRIKEA